MSSSLRAPLVAFVLGALVLGALVLAGLAVPAATASASAPPVAPDLSGDMRVLPADTQARVAASEAKQRAQAASGGTTVHHVYVAVVDAVSGTANDDRSLADLGESAVTAAVASASAFWAAESNGAVSFVVSGYRTDQLGRSSCDPDSVVAAEASAFPGHSFSGISRSGAYDHLLVLTTEGSACDSRAFATVGGSSGAIFSANGIDPSMGVPVLEHELGHNLGLGHAGSTLCASDTVFDIPAGGSSTCDTDEYGDLLDIMGYSVPGSAPHLSAIQRIALGWFAGSATSITAPGTSSVAIAALDGIGVRAARLVDPVSGGVYVVEYRTASGADATSAEWGGSCHADVFEGYTKCSMDSSAASGSVRVLRAFDHGTYVSTTVLAAGEIGGDPTRRHTHLGAGDVFVSAAGGLALRVDTMDPAVGAQLTVAIGTDATALARTRVATTSTAPAPTAVAATGAAVAAPTARLAVHLVHRRLRVGKHPVVSAHVTVDGVGATNGTLRIVAGHRVITRSMQRAIDGSIVVRLPRSSARGRVAVRVSYVGAASAEAPRLVLRVV